MKKTIEYAVIIYYSKEDGHYIAEVPDLPGCMADGKSYSEAAANAETIIAEWLESALLDGEAIPEPADGRTVKQLEYLQPVATG